MGDVCDFSSICRDHIDLYNKRVSSSEAVLTSFGATAALQRSIPPLRLMLVVSHQQTYEIYFLTTRSQAVFKHQVATVGDDATWIKLLLYIHVSVSL